MKNSRVSVIIPAYNESDSIGTLVSELNSLHPDAEIIVVNDGSVDNTAEVSRAAGARVVSHPYNIGNGAAVKTGIRHAQGDILVLMDGDGQHQPEDVSTLLSHFPEYDMVVGKRDMHDQASIGRAFMNKIYNMMASYVAKFKIEDLTSGFRAVKADIAGQLLYLLPNSYSYPTTLTLGVLRNGRTIKYVPIRVGGRLAGKSSIRPIKDGVRFFMIIVKICTLFSPFRVFLPVSFATFVTGLSYYMYTFFKWGRFTNMSALLFSTSVIIFMMGLVSEQICQMRFEKSEKL